jgi:hypothetical protein
VPILYGGRAYKMPTSIETENEIDALELARPGSTLLSCPSCGAQYGLRVEANASEETHKEYVQKALHSIEKSCPNHASPILID